MSTPETLAKVKPPFAEQAPKCTTDSCARDRIFEAAKNLFYRYGIRGVSVDAIAEEADTTKVTLYRVFSSKDELIVEVLKDHSRCVFEWWDSVVAPHAGEPRKQLEAVFEGIRQKLRRDEAQRGCPIMNAAVEIVEPDHPAREVIGKYKLEINRRLRELCREMGAQEPETLGDALTLLISGIFTTRLGDHGAKRADSVYEAAMALLDSPLGAARPPSSKKR
jgi:AcrR family transcriptional regulator